MEHMVVPSGESSRKRELDTTLTTKPPLMGLHVACTSSSPSHPLLDPIVREDAWPWT